MWKHWKLRVALIVVLATLNVQGNSMAGRLIPGAVTPAPEIRSSVWINGGPTSLAALRGQVVLVEFWTYG
jgi:hypothetical protein